MRHKVDVVGNKFGARLAGIDLRTRTSPETKEEIEQALAHYGVVSLGPQKIGDEEQQSFIELFGPAYEAAVKEAGTNHKNFYDITTVDEHGRQIEEGSMRALVLLGNSLWHTDGSQAQPPTRISALHARVLPPSPPPTEYADMRAAWDALPAGRQKELEGLSIVHDFFWSREQIGVNRSSFSEETLRRLPPVAHPLVRTNPITGRKSLYLASHASHPEGWPLEQGRALMKELIAHATQRQFVYSHQWVPDELVLWDDRWTMHRATPYQEPHPRKMRWCGARETVPV